MILFAMAMMCSIVMAQTETTRTIHGAVIDKNGNPLPGAVVSATEGAETTLVNPDGTFDLEIPIWLKSVTASYAGYYNKKMKPLYDRDMIFRLKKDNKRYGFLNAYGGLATYDGYIMPSIGLMGGMLSNVGFYVKIGMTPILVGGITKRIYKNFYAYLGIGYGTVAAEVYENNYYDIEWYPGMAFDGGLIFGIGRHFNVSIGYTHTADFEGYWNCIPNVTLGYVF